MEYAEQIADAGLDLATCPDVRTCCVSLQQWTLRLTRAQFVEVRFRDADGSMTIGRVPSDGSTWYTLEPGPDDAMSRWTAELGVSEPARAESDRMARMLARQASLGIRRVIGLEHLNRHERQLQALVEAGKALTRERTLDGVLRRIVDQAMELTGARYGALGVLDEDRRELAAFVTRGIDDATKRQIGDLPRGLGILGVLIKEPQPLRLRRLQDHPMSVGFPPNHPPMSSFLGMPIITSGDVAGRIYLTEKRGAAEFSDEDEAIVETLASQAAIAIENASLNDRLRTTAAQLEEASRHKSTFLANMSHELRSPLNTIIGYTRLLLDEPERLDEEQLEDLRIVKDSGEHLLALITDLLDLQRIEAGRVVLTVADEDILDIVDGVAASVRPTVPEGVELRTDTVGVSEPALRCDRTRLRQVLLNLIGNAVKFTETGTITVTVRNVDQDVVIAVRDTGPGIPEADQTRIFESFYQSQAAVSRTPHPREGAGLGLAITRLLTELHGGTVLLESALGVGTTVTIRIPRRGPTQEVS